MRKIYSVTLNPEELPVVKKIKIGYTDNWDTYLDDVQIKSISDGGSYFENMLSVAITVYHKNMAFFRILQIL